MKAQPYFVILLNTRKDLVQRHSGISKHSIVGTGFYHKTEISGIMANRNPQNQFKKGAEKTIAAGKKSKRGLSMTTLLLKALEKNPDKLTKEWLEKETGRKITGGNYAKLIAQTHVVESLQGNMTAIKEIYDRVDGKQTQGVDITGDLSITVNIQRDVTRG